MPESVIQRGYLEQHMGYFFAELDLNNSKFSTGCGSDTLKFLLDPEGATAAKDYADLVKKLDTFFTDHEVRIVITFSDGTVAYDRGKGAANTYDNALKPGGINVNHNSRISVMTALLSSSGVGFERKFSTSTDMQMFYMARRFGYSQDNSIGCVILSVGSSSTVPSR